MLVKTNLLLKTAMAVTHEALNETIFSSKCLLLLQTQAYLSRLNKLTQNKILQECNRHLDHRQVKHHLQLSYLLANRMLKLQPEVPLEVFNKVPPPTTEVYNKSLPLQSKMTNFKS